MAGIRDWMGGGGASARFSSPLKKKTFPPALGEVQQKSCLFLESYASRDRFPPQRPLRSSPLLPQVLTHIEDVEGQPVEEGVTDQLGKQQTQGELDHTLGSVTEGAMETGARGPWSVSGAPTQHFPPPTAQSSLEDLSSLSNSSVPVAWICCVRTSLPCSPPQVGRPP